MPNERSAADHTKDERWAFYEEMWNSPGFSKMTSNYRDLLTDEAVNAEWCEFLTGKIRGIVTDPEVADKLIPDHLYGQRRPPYGTNYFETYNKANVSLVDLKATPILRVTEHGIETADGVREFDIIVWATGFDFGTGALNRMGIRGRSGVALEESWADGPSTYLGVACRGFPNLFFPGGPHGSTGNNPRYAGDQVDFVTDALVFMREQGYDVFEVSEAAEDYWSGMVNAYASTAPFSEASYFFGANIPGKPIRYLLNPGGRPKLQSSIARDTADGFTSFEFGRVRESTG
jgi:cation diffusion facilitator CzcD-associated flavoprotein CzcO